MSIDSCATFFFFFFNDTATTEIYTLSLHDALPIFAPSGAGCGRKEKRRRRGCRRSSRGRAPWFLPVSDPKDRKSTRLNSSHGYISYAVFCLKKKKKHKHQRQKATVRAIHLPPRRAG